MPPMEIRLGSAGVFLWPLSQSASTSADLTIPPRHADSFCPSLSLPARHGDGLYDSYMRTDHILKDEAETNSPSGLPPMPKHTVSMHTSTHTHTKAVKPYFLCWSMLCLQTSCSSERYSSRSSVPHSTTPPSLSPLRLVWPGE